MIVNKKGSAVDEKYGKSLISTALEKIALKDYEKGTSLIVEAENYFVQKGSKEYVSICLSIWGYLEYLTNPKCYNQAISKLNDAKNVAQLTTNITATLVNELFTAHLNFVEKNERIAFLHYQNARNYALKDDEFNLINVIDKSLTQISSERHAQSSKKDPLMSLVKIGQAVAAETSIDTLIKVIAEETKEAIEADRCSVFLYDKEHNELWSKVALGMDAQEIRFPAGKGLAGHVVKTGETINIKDAYNDDRFNQEIDKQTGYHTKNILCMPIKNLNQEIIGAFQVLNKLTGDFTAEDEDLLVAIGSSAGISLENAQLFEKQQEMYREQKELFDSFIDTLATSIDARDKITAGHSARVRLYSSLIAKQFNMTSTEIEIIEKAATLHDIGKIGIRDSVLQKEGKLTDEEYKHIQEHVVITHNILEKIHLTGAFQAVTDIACTHHEKYNGTGYYQHLKGEGIPFGGRILAVADVFDAITSKRHYRDKMPIVNVINILISDSGTHFDGNIVDKFLSIPSDEIIEVFLTENHSTLLPEDKNKLTNFTLRNLYDMAQKTDAKTAEEEEFINLFNKYYLHHTEQLHKDSD